MGHKIQRIDCYSDQRFEPEILRQHGAFIVDGEYRCGFRIIDQDSAVVFHDPEVNVSELIDEFRFYAEHIVNFYDGDMRLLKSFAPLEIFSMKTEDIQPSQFFVDMDKVAAIAGFIKGADDIIIPVVRAKELLVSCDGHTRLYYATAQGYTTVRAFFTDPGDYLEWFVQEARRRGVYSPHDLRPLPHEEYKVKWHQFCDEFFSRKES